MKVNVLDLTQRLNSFRISHQDGRFTYPQVLDVLQGLGFSKTISQALAAKLPSEMMGANKIYKFGNQPIHKSEIEAIYKRMASYAKKTYKEKKSPFNQEDAVSKLQKLGYQIRRPIGFDEERFRKECPELYLKYQKYEEI